MEKTFKIYLLKNYKVKAENFDKKLKLMTIEEVEKQLKKNKGAHLRIDINNPSILYLDIDNMPNKEIFENLLNKISKFFRIEKDEIFYTESLKENIYSFHLSIPSLYVKSPLDIKTLLSSDDFKEFKEYIDTSIYSNKWFRLPFQTNEEKPIPHNIINGSLSNFIIEYIPEHSKEFIIKEEIKEPVKAEIIKENPINSTINKCLECLNLERCNDFKEWIKVVMIIYNELGNNGYNILKNWSKKSINYNEENNKTIWNNLKQKEGKQLKIGSLIFMAKEDNLELYNKLFNINEILNFNDTFSTGLLSDYFKSIYNNFIYSNGVLYNYNGVYWKPDDKNNSNINNFVDSEFYKHLFNKVCDYYKTKGNEEENNDQIIKQFQDKLKELKMIRNGKSREVLINDIIRKITNNDIKFDENPFLFAFNNKIFDLKQNIFITPTPEQLISMTTGYNYIEDINLEENIKFLNDLFKTILPDDEIREYYFTLMATGLDGVPLEKIIIANGGGRNGKGLLDELIQYCLGDYAYVLSSSVLTEKAKSSGASNPDVAGLNNKRWVVSREPEKDKSFNDSMLKELTGGTEIKARMNYSNNTKVNLCLTFIIECNKKPLISEVGDATAERIIDVLFPNKFLSKEKYEDMEEDDRKGVYIKNDFFKTLEFKEKYKIALFHILTNYYHKFYLNNREIITPKAILRRNQAYLESSDELLSWINENYKKTDNKKHYVKISTIYEKYKESEFFENLTKVEKRKNNKKNFIEKLENNYFLKKLVKLNNDKCTCLYSYQILDDDEEGNNDTELN